MKPNVKEALDPTDPPGLDEMPPYTIKEVTVLTGLSAQTVTRLFEDEPGVIAFEEKRPGKRSYRTLRIPRWVFQRVIKKLTVQ